MRDRARLARLQLVEPAARVVHGLLAVVGADQVQRHFEVALAVDQCQRHLVELAVDQLGGVAEHLQPLRVVGVVCADLRHQLGDARQPLVVGLEVAFLAGQQEAALAGLGVDQLAVERGQLGLHALRADHVGIAFAQADIAGFRRHQHRQRQHDAAREQQRVGEEGLLEHGAIPVVEARRLPAQRQGGPMESH
ncbi:hypothetical protein D3C72_1714780 [compost metagenome]